MTTLFVFGIIGALAGLLSASNGRGKLNLLLIGLVSIIHFGIQYLVFVSGIAPGLSSSINNLIIGLATGASAYLAVQAFKN